MPLTVKVVVPTLVSVTVWAGLVVPMGTEAKYRLVGESLAVVPIPVRPTFCGLPAALSVTLSIAARVLNAVGLKVTLMLQLDPAANASDDEPAGLLVSESPYCFFSCCYTRLPSFLQLGLGFGE